MINSFRVFDDGVAELRNPSSTPKENLVPAFCAGRRTFAEETYSGRGIGRECLLVCKGTDIVHIVYGAVAYTADYVRIEPSPSITCKACDAIKYGVCPKHPTIGMIFDWLHTNGGDYRAPFTFSRPKKGTFRDAWYIGSYQGPCTYINEKSCEPLLLKNSQGLRLKVVEHNIGEVKFILTSKKIILIYPNEKIVIEDQWVYFWDTIHPLAIGFERLRKHYGFTRNLIDLFDIIDHAGLPAKSAFTYIQHVALISSVLPQPIAEEVIENFGQS
jgi:hypothetical protein